VNKFYNEDLPYGEIGEMFVLSIINRKHPKAHKMEGYFIEYDIMIPEIDKTIEVKRDKHTDRTGNAFIETYCNHVKSGINTTTANYWAYLTKTMLYWIKSDDLKRCIKDNNIAEGKNFRIDGKLIDAHLIPIDIFKNYCMRIDTLTEEQLCQLN